VLLNAVNIFLNLLFYNANCLSASDSYILISLHNVTS
jgi:hypothetical protein